MFAANVLAPLNLHGDQQGASGKDGVVTTPEGFKEAYTASARRLERACLPSPNSAARACRRCSRRGAGDVEAANMAFSLCPLLTGAVEACSARLGRAEGLPAEDGRRRVDRHDEPHRAPGGLRPRRRCARRRCPNGEHYRISGTKIFITWGEHDMAENIVHLVLARLPDAPPGVKGISLFIVPEVPGQRGRYARRAQRPASAPRSSTSWASTAARPRACPCDEGAVGYLVGEGTRPRIHVHDDEPRPPRRRARRRGGRRARLPAGARPTRGSGCRAGRSQRRAAAEADHPAPRRAPHAAAHEGRDRGDARLAYYTAAAMDRAHGHRTRPSARHARRWSTC